VVNSLVKGFEDCRTGRKIHIGNPKRKYICRFSAGNGKVQFNSVSIMAVGDLIKVE
jgi:hypothetical protein